MKDEWGWQGLQKHGLESDVQGQAQLNENAPLLKRSYKAPLIPDQISLVLSLLPPPSKEKHAVLFATSPHPHPCYLPCCPTCRSASSPCRCSPPSWHPLAAAAAAAVLAAAADPGPGGNLQAGSEWEVIVIAACTRRQSSAQLLCKGGGRP